MISSDTQYTASQIPLTPLRKIHAVDNLRYILYQLVKMLHHAYIKWNIHTQDASFMAYLSRCLVQHFANILLKFSRNYRKLSNTVHCWVLTLFSSIQVFYISSLRRRLAASSSAKPNLHCLLLPSGEWCHSTRASTTRPNGQQLYL